MNLLSVIWQVCNIFMSGFFGLAAYVQINDPDAALWMVGYAVPAVLCVFVGVKPRVTESLVWRRLADLHVMVSTAAVAMLGWTLHPQRITDVFQQEEGRELSGLALTVVWLLLSRHSGRAPVGILRVCTAVAVTTFPFVAWIYFYVHKELRSNWPSHCKTAI